MSRINYNQIPLQEQQTPPPQQQYRGRGVSGGNGYRNYQNGGNNYRYRNRYNNRNGDNQYRYRRNTNYYNRRSPSPYYYRRTTFYNRNYQRQRDLDDRSNYGYHYRSPRRFYRSTQRSYQNRPRSRSIGEERRRRRSQSRQPRTRGPRQLTMKDFLSPNLRSDLNLATTTEVPANALPQRQNSATTAANTTQPFTINQDSNPNSRQQQERQTITTSSYRRRQRRNQQQQYRQNPRMDHNNRYAVLAEEEEEDTNNDIGNDIEPLPVVINDKNKNKNKNNKKTKSRAYLEHKRIFKWFNNNTSLQEMVKSRGNQKYILDSTPIYDEWVRTIYESEVWENYLKMGLEQKHWAKEVVQRARKRDDIENGPFIQKKIDQFTSKKVQLGAKITGLQIQLGTYWSQVPTSEKSVPIRTESTITTTETDNNIIPSATTTTMANRNENTNPERIRNNINKIENAIIDYIKECTQHVKKSSQARIQLAKAQMDEFKALDDFKLSATPLHWHIHLTLKPKIKVWSTKDKNYRIAQKRVEYNLPPKFIANTNFTFKIDEALLNPEDAQAIYNDMRRITSEFRTNAMTLYVQTAEREAELIQNEINELRKSFPKTNTEEEVSYDAFQEYHELRLKRLANRGRKQEESRRRRRNCPNLCSRTPQGYLAPTIINEAPQTKLTEEEYRLLNLGPRFIFNDPKTASRRRTIELATLRRKIETRFYEKKVSPGRPVQQFIAELDILLQNLHDIRTNSNRPQSNLSITILNDSVISSQPQLNRLSKKKNYSRLVKRLKHKFRLSNTIIRKTDKSKVFHLGRLENYQKRSEEYMDRTKAYLCLGIQNPLPDLIHRTNTYLFQLRLAKWITQKQYEQLFIKTDEVELAHLYYLPKAHKPGTPLRPIISGLKHPTIKISKFLDNLLRPLFDRMALSTTITSGFELIKQLQQWSQLNMKQETLLCTIDVADLYTMIPQVEGVLSLKKMLDHLGLKQINGLKTEVILRLARFVMQNNYFSYNGQYYHQIRGGAMGSPLTLTIANCYMFFFERDIFKQIKNSHGLYFRYIDDLFITVNWPIRHFIKQVDRWNKFDTNIKLSANISFNADFLDLHMENQDGQLFTTVYHKPSYEPYYLPFNSIHPMHMKKNIPFTMLLRGIRYCSTFQAYLNERGKLRMALLLNKYPGEFIDQQFTRFLLKFNIDEPLTTNNYNKLRQRVIDTPYQERVPIDYGKTIFVHFTYCSNMRTFPAKFHTLWQKYFDESPINEITPILGTRNVHNLQRRLVHTRQ